MDISVIQINIIIPTVVVNWETWIDRSCFQIEIIPLEFGPMNFTGKFQFHCFIMQPNMDLKPPFPILTPLFMVPSPCNRWKP